MVSFKEQHRMQLLVSLHSVRSFQDSSNRSPSAAHRQNCPSSDRGYTFQLRAVLTLFELLHWTEFSLSIAALSGFKREPCHCTMLKKDVAGMFWVR